MNKSNRRPLRANQRILDDMRTALHCAEDLAGTDDDRCGIDAAHRKAVSLYVNTWVAGPLRRAILNMGAKP
jgi:hypothetical protein